jgi:hypothetical protein
VLGALLEDRAALDICITAGRTLYQACSANFLFSLVTTFLLQYPYIWLSSRFALVKQRKPEKSMKKVKPWGF